MGRMIMSVNLFKTASATARELGQELRDVLNQIDPDVGRPLLDRLRLEAHPTPLLVFTGQYSSGKSTLLKALTDGSAAVVIGSGVTTDEVEEFDWDGDVRLVDTPGVHAGRPHHDVLAEKALQTADLVLFAVTVELFDDLLISHLRDVLGRLGKSKQTLVVVTKAGTMQAAEGVRGRAIDEAAGSFGPIPWVECDAQYYLGGRALSATDPDSSEEFIKQFGLKDVAAFMNRFAQQQGELGRLSQPLQLIVALALEASASLVFDPDEQAALTVLARQRSALSKRQIHLNHLLEARAAQLRSEAVRAATRFADGLEGDEGRTLEDREVALDAHLASLNDDLGVAFDRFEDALRQLLEAQFDDLASEVREIEASPYGRVTVRLGDPEIRDLDPQQVNARLGGVQQSLPPRPAWAGDMSKYLKQFNDFWGAGNGIQAAAGSAGHNVVYTVGKAFGKKFKPWEAVKTANTIGKFAKFGGVAISIGLEAYGLIAEERAAAKEERARAERRRSIAQGVLGQADTIVIDALGAVSSDLHNSFSPAIQKVDTMAQEIERTRATRSDLLGRLVGLRYRAESASAALFVTEQEPDASIG